jgi:hypothetical protein
MPQDDMRERHFCTVPVEKTRSPERGTTPPLARVEATEARAPALSSTEQHWK